MKSLFFLTAIVVVLPLGAVDISVVPSGDNVTQQERQTYIADLKKRRRIVIDDKEAKRVLSENRMLANAWLKTHTLKASDLYNTRHSLEAKFANALIDEAQDKIKTNDDVLKSYYVVHQSEFTYGDLVDFTAFSFKDFDAAYDFYKQNAASPVKADAAAKEAKIEQRSKTQYPRERLDPVLNNVIGDDVFEEPYLTIPVKFKKEFLVLRIDGYVKDAPVPYEKAKKRIRRTLLNETRLTARKVLLETLKGDD